MFMTITNRFIRTSIVLLLFIIPGLVHDISAAADSPNFFQVAEPRMGEDVYHIGFVLFVENDLENLRYHLKMIKSGIPGDYSNGTAFKGPDGTVQLAVHIEFGAYEYSVNESDSLNGLKSILTTILEEGFAVHLLLSGDYVPVDFWKGKKWSELTVSAKNFYLGEFVPYQPSLFRKLKDNHVSPWDIIFENFHVPVINYLKKESLLNSLAVIYIMNEFGYMTTRTDTDKNWEYRDDWEIYSAECLAKTAERGLELCRAAAEGQVQIGLKFADILEPLTGWGVLRGSDQFSYIIKNVMAPKGDVLGFDSYWTPSINLYNPEFKYRLTPFLPLFPSGSFTIPEYGRDCDGTPDNYTFGERISVTEMTGLIQAWPESRSYLLYAFNSVDCYSNLDPETNGIYPSARENFRGIWEQIKYLTGSDTPEIVKVKERN